MASHERRARVTVDQAREAARSWVSEEASGVPGFRGAFTVGSTNWLHGSAALPVTSDLDVTVVHTDPASLPKLGKQRYRNVLLDVSYVSAAAHESPDQVLGDYHRAASLCTASILSDPTGQLTGLQRAVSRDYAKRAWVRKRCEQARDKVVQRLRRLSAREPFHAQVLTWLFPTGVTTHVLLVAGLENPTVRRRYVAVQELLADYGHGKLYEALLEVLGGARMSQVRAEQHLAALTTAFDAARAVIVTPFAFAGDISEMARPIAIDGSRELIEGGKHRESLFWMLATYSRCQTVLYHDAPLERRDQFASGYSELLADLGIITFADLEQRAARVRDLLPRIWRAAEAIMAANPKIET